eukprot:jgi/Tetstr1/427025/TSEL_017230.t1
MASRPPHPDRYTGHEEYYIGLVLNTPILGTPLRGWHLLIVAIILALRYFIRRAMAPEAQVRARHVLVATEAECTSLKAKIDAGELTFAAAAEGYSTCPSGRRGGQLGTFGPGRMVPAFDKVCFSPTTPLNTAVGPVQTHFGFHLLLVEYRHIPGADKKAA